MQFILLCCLDSFFVKDKSAFVNDLDFMLYAENFKACHWNDMVVDLNF